MEERLAQHIRQPGQRNYEGDRDEEHRNNGHNSSSSPEQFRYTTSSGATDKIHPRIKFITSSGGTMY